MHRLVAIKCRSLCGSFGQLGLCSLEHLYGRQIMRCPVPVRHARRVLCVSPAYSPSFGTFSHAYPLLGGVEAFMPPQGLLVIAAYLPEQWPVRFIDENMG